MSELTHWRLLYNN